MPLSCDASGKPVHFPKKDRFEFDEEVAQIFPDMARRAIPMYAEVHRLHASLIKRLYGLYGRFSVLDIGASRGQFLSEICNQFQIDVSQGSADIELYALESSAPMLEHLRRDFPCIGIIEADICRPPLLGSKFDVVSLLYVLQFIPHEHKREVLAWLHADVVRPGGLLILGQKEDIASGYMTTALTEEYMGFRARNGYSAEEITAKTEALKKSMWTLRNDELVAMLRGVGFWGFEETSRWTMFSTLVCRG